MGGSLFFRPGARALALSVALLAIGSYAATASATTGEPRGGSPSQECRITPLPPLGAQTPFDGICAYLAQRDPDVVTQATIYDDTTGNTYALTTGDDPQYTASIAKVDILAEWLYEYQRKRGSIPKSLGYSLQYLLQSMIENSDNRAATSLFYFGGGCKALTDFNRRIPMNHTKVGCETSDYYGWGNTLTTATDQVQLMKAFAYGSNHAARPGVRRKAIRNCKRKTTNPRKRRACLRKVKHRFKRLSRTPVLNQAARAYGLSLMENIEADQSWGLTCGPWGDVCDAPNYAPPDPDVTVAHKNGWKTLPAPVCTLPLAQCPWQVNSTGWVSGKGRDYVLSILTTNNPAGPQITDGFDYGIDTIQQMSRLIWSNLGPAG